MRAKVHNSEKKIGLLCGIAFCKQYGFVGHNAILRALDTKHIFTALLALLQILFKIVHEWQTSEAEVGKHLGHGMNPRRAILYHVSEFMSAKRVSRLRTSLRRRQLSSALQSVDSSMESERQAAVTLQGGVTCACGSKRTEKYDGGSYCTMLIDSGDGRHLLSGTHISRR